jgi:hypothetical protein
MCHIARCGQFSTAYRATCAWAVATLSGTGNRRVSVVIDLQLSGMNRRHTLCP